jgi:hypothetical protein
VSPELGHAGYISRPVHSDDPLVCILCGLTIGTRSLDSDAKRLAEVEAEHKPECKRRQNHQLSHRTSDGTLEE